MEDAFSIDLDPMEQTICPSSAKLAKLENEGYQLAQKDDTAATMAKFMEVARLCRACPYYGDTGCSLRSMRTDFKS